MTMKAEEEVRNVEPAYSVYGDEAPVRRRPVAPPVSAWVAAAAAPVLPPRHQPPSSSYKPKPTTLRAFPSFSLPRSSSLSRSFAFCCTSIILPPFVSAPSVAAMLNRRRIDAAGTGNETNGSFVIIFYRFYF